MKIERFILAAALVASMAAPAMSACPNAAASVTIPISGVAAVTVYDQACDPLAGPWAVYNGISAASTPVTATSSPAFTSSAGGGVIQFTANGAPTGSAGTFHIVFSPNGTSANLSYTVGAPVTGLSFGTTTP